MEKLSYHANHFNGFICTISDGFRTCVIPAKHGRCEKAEQGSDVARMFRPLKNFEDKDAGRTPLNCVLALHHSPKIVFQRIYLWKNNRYCFSIFVEGHKGSDGQIRETEIFQAYNVGFVHFT